MTAFQQNALSKIRHIGGKIFYATDKRWTDSHGQTVFVPSEDFKTDGFIGWPTIKALMDAERLYLRGGNEYALTAKA